MFGRRVADERRRLGISQLQLADQLGIGRSGVGMLETDRSPLEAGRLVELGKSGFDVLFILSGEPGSLAASRFMNWSLLAEIEAAINDWSATNQIPLAADKRTILLKLLYERFASSGEVEPSVVRDAFALAA